MRVRRVIETAFWDAHSFTWDSSVTKLAARSRAIAVAERLRAYVRSDAPVLDLGCATGELTIALRQAGYAAVGVDFSEGMLRHARGKAAATGAEFVRADLNVPLPFPKATASAAVCLGALQCVDSPPLFLREVQRVLHPGGVLLIEVKSDPQEGAVIGGETFGAREFSLVKRFVSRRPFVRMFERDALVNVLSESRFAVREDFSHGPWLRFVAEGT